MTLKKWNSEMSKLRRKLGLTSLMQKPAVRAELATLKAKKPAAFMADGAPPNPLANFIRTTEAKVLPDSDNIPPTL